jgi:ABC-type transport system substrate-binding protein
MQQELAQVGIKVRVQTNQFPELLEKIDKKRAQFWGIAWLADYPDAENFLQLLYGPNKAPSPNGSNFDNAEYNKLYTQVRGMADSPERRAMINQMKAIFVREMPWIVEAHRIRYNLSHAWISNYKADYMGGTPAKFLRVDTARRAQGLK